MQTFIYSMDDLSESNVRRIVENTILQKKEEEHEDYTFSWLQCLKCKQIIATKPCKFDSTKFKEELWVGLCERCKSSMNGFRQSSLHELGIW